MVAVGRGLQPWFGLVLLASLTVAARVPPSAVKSRLAPAPVQQCLDKSPLAKLRGGTCVTEGVDSSLFESSRFAALEAWHPVLLALLGTSFGWFMTALGAAAVVIKRLGLPEPIFRKVLDFFLGVSGGVMTAASYWSLLAPALEFAEQQGWEDGWAAVPVALGFLSGGALLQLTDAAMHQASPK